MQRFSAFMFLLFSWLTLASTPLLAAGSRILILGDSLSAAYRIPIEKSWPALLQQRLGRDRAEIVNASISGETTDGGRQRLPALLRQQRPDILILELGGNDGLRGLPFSRTRKNLTAMIESARQSGAQVLLIGVRMPPNLGAAYNRRFQKIFSDLAAQYDIAFLPRFLEGVAAGKPGLMQADGIHPTAKAQPILAQKVEQALQALLSGR